MDSMNEQYGYDIAFLKYNLEDIKNKFNEKSIEVDLLKEKNIIIEEELNKFKEKSKEVDLLKEKNMTIEEELKEIKNHHQKIQLLENELLLSKKQMERNEKDITSVKDKVEEIVADKQKEEEEDRWVCELVKEVGNKVVLEQEEVKKIVLQRHIGDPEKVTISSDNHVEFIKGYTHSTVAAPSALVSRGKKVWYEVTFKRGGGWSRIGWATTEFKTSDKHEHRWVGGCTNSYSFNGQLRYKEHNMNATRWGKKFEPKGDQVLGVAADMKNGQILFSLNGDWTVPMGMAFDNIDKNICLFPAITGYNNMTLFINFGDVDFTYGPPDSSFEKLKYAVSSTRNSTK